MTFVDWAHVALPLLCLGWGLCFVALYPEAIDAWVSKVDAWYSAAIAEGRRNRR